MQRHNTNNGRTQSTSTSQGGFTIVERLAVVVVIAILAAITVAVYSGIQRQASETALKSDLKNGATQLELSRIANGSYPGTDGEKTDGGDLTKSRGTTFQCTRTGDSYCMTATSDRDGVPAFMISSDDNSPCEGTCPGHIGSSTGGGGSEIVANSPIQNVTQAQCQAFDTFTGGNSGAVRTVTDTRGGTTRTYEIAKLADGKCWMLTNLKLGGSSPITLTSSDSNVSSSFMLQLSLRPAQPATTPRRLWVQCLATAAQVRPTMATCITSRQLQSVSPERRSQREPGRQVTASARLGGSYQQAEMLQVTSRSETLRCSTQPLPQVRQRELKVTTRIGSTTAHSRVSPRATGMVDSIFRGHTDTCGRLLIDREMSVKRTMRPSPPLT